MLDEGLLLFPATFFGVVMKHALEQLSHAGQVFCN